MSVSYFHVSGPAVPLVGFCACTEAATKLIKPVKRAMSHTVVIDFVMILSFLN